MEFCPKCETRLVRKKGELSLICPKCGESIEKTDQIKKEKPNDSDSNILIMDESDMNEANTLKSTDEPETRFYKCIKCNHTWRDYT